jgi:predicted ABC-type ATPase
MTDRRKPPTLHVIAGPNGSGKSTLYANQLQKRFPDIEFVNADLLALKHFGHSATTAAESATGQRLAEERRAALLSERKSLIVESTFSHPSKVDLVREAKTLGYKVALYHVNVRSSDISVFRVASRVTKGGHDVPENKTRERFVRNQPLIREAVLLADSAMIFDNSKIGSPHALAITFDRGRVAQVNDPVPAWARELYAQELERYSPKQLNSPSVSFAQAGVVAREAIGANARTFIARSDGSYKGRIIGETELHVVQQIGASSAVAHFKSRLDHVPAIGEQIAITYDLQKNAQGHVEPNPLRQIPPMDAARQKRVDDAVKLIELAAKHIPPENAGSLTPAVMLVNHEGSQRIRTIMRDHPTALERFEKALKAHAANLAPHLAREARNRKNDPDLSR